MKLQHRLKANCARLISIALSVTLTAIASAGHYVITKSGGTVSAVAWMGTNPNSAYSDTMYGYGGGIAGYHQSISCSGQVDYHVVWTPDYVGDLELPPEAVIVAKTCTATANGSNVAVTNGLGDAPVTSGTSKTSSGTHYELHTTDADDFHVTFTPSASAVFAGGAPPSGSVYSGISLSPVSISLSGPITFSNSENILVGQSCTGSFVGIPAGVTPDDPVWTPGGKVFATWTGSLTSGVLDANPNLQLMSPVWRWVAGGGGSGTADGPHDTTVTASVDLYDGTSFMGTAVLHKDLNVWRPYQYMAGNFTDPYWDPASPIDGVRAHANIAARLGTPAPFVMGGDEGLGAFCQLIDAVDSLKDGSVVLGGSTTNSQYWLDAATGDVDWPYNYPPESVPIVAPGVGTTLTPLTDTPGWPQFAGGGYTADYYKIDYKFRTWLMYRAPGAGNLGWIPSSKIEWIFDSTCTAPWPTTPPGVCEETASGLTDEHPGWTNTSYS